MPTKLTNQNYQHNQHQISYRGCQSSEEFELGEVLGDLGLGDEHRDRLQHQSDRHGYLVLGDIGRKGRYVALVLWHIVYCGTVLHGVLSWYLGHISSMHGSVVGVSRVVSGLDQSEEGMTVRRVEAKVADQTW